MTQTSWTTMTDAMAAPAVGHCLHARQTVARPSIGRVAVVVDAASQPTRSHGNRSLVLSVGLIEPISELHASFARTDMTRTSAVPASQTTTPTAAAAGVRRSEVLISVFDMLTSPSPTSP